MRVPIPIALAASAAFVVLAPAPGHPCSCTKSTLPAHEDAKYYAAVFVGQPVETRLVLFPTNLLYFERSGDSGERTYQVYVKFRVRESWKGISHDTVWIRTGTGAGDCGYDFSLGDTYLVFAEKGAAGLMTDACTRTNHVNKAAQDLQDLGDANIVFDQPPLPDDEWRQLAGTNN